MNHVLQVLKKCVQGGTVGFSLVATVMMVDEKGDYAEHFCLMPLQG